MFSLQGGGHSLFPSVPREELGLKALLLHIKRSQLRWLGHLFRMPPGHLPRKVKKVAKKREPEGAEESGQGKNSLGIIGYWFPPTIQRHASWMSEVSKFLLVCNCAQ